MHPCLSIANFSKLPRHLKSLAVAVASGAHEETLALLQSLPTLAPEHSLSLFPAFHLALDPALISVVLSRFDSSGWDSIRSDIVRVHRCLSGLLQLATRKAIPPGASVHLWEHIWPWMQFLDECEETLSGNDFRDASFSPQSRYFRFLSIIRFLRDDEAAKVVIDSTEGRWVVIGRAWRHFIHADNDLGLDPIAHFLGLWPRAPHLKPCAFKELILGAGGTWTHLASLVVSHIKRCLPYPDSSFTQRFVIPVLGVIHILAHENAGENEDPYPVFQAALLSCGIVAALTTAARAVCQSAVTHADTVLHMILTALINHLSLFPSVYLVESLRAGLLEILFSSKHRHELSRSMMNLLKTVIFPATVYRSLLVQLPTFISQVRNRNAAAIFRDTSLLAQWMRLLEVVKSRSHLAEKHATGVLTVTGVCDDLGCARTRSKKDLKCCSGCLTAYYCSPTCQANDWRHGGHRQTCRDFLFRQNQLAQTSSRDRSFLRALIHQEYMVQREEIAHKHHLFAEAAPGQMPVILFDFLSGACCIEVGMLPDIESPFDVDVDRATRSGGQIQLHFVKVKVGPQYRQWPFHVHLNCVGLEDAPQAARSTL
ncbi:hypothetical protein C8R45DRAFT_971447 [Mycena sanguinolenta]|nr:hypothetical protein C8R45DRAFT_971447 [Mycena sanguinolenta]